MYLFTRQTRLSDGNGTAGVEWARSVAEKINELTGHEIRLWGNAFSPGSRTITWTGWFEHLQAIETAGDQLTDNPGMEKLVKAGTRYTEGGLDDGLIQLIHGAPADEGTRYLSSVISVARPGDIARAMAAGVEIARKSEAITGVPVRFGRALTGPCGEVHWMTPHESVTTMQKADTELASDPSWIGLFDSTKGLFIADTTTTQATIYRRLG